VPRPTVLRGLGVLLQLAVVLCLGTPSLAKRRPRARSGAPAGSQARQATSVALLPLRDVGSADPAASTPLGVALRAILERDLRALPGIEVVESGRADGALAAEGLAPGAEPSPAQLGRAGRALTAGWWVSAAYAVKPDEVMVWARFVRSEHGKLAGTATAGGPAAELLRACNAIEAELLRLIGAPRAQVEQVARRVRPGLRTPAVLERFGEALGEADPVHRRRRLQLALDADPTFGYAARDLEELDRQKPGGDPDAAPVRERALREAAERYAEALRREPDPARFAERTLQRFAELQRQRRWRTLIAEATAIIKSPPPAVPELGEQLPETAQYMIVAAHDQLSDDDALVREGQRYLARYPLSDGFVAVRQLVDDALTRARERDEGRPKAAAALAKLPPAERDDPCRAGDLLETHHQLPEARAALERCVAQPGAHDHQFAQLLFICHRLGDFRAVGQLLDLLRREHPEQYRQVMHLADELPSD